jgi:hypothetical protein
MWIGTITGVIQPITRPKARRPKPAPIAAPQSGMIPPIPSPKTAPASSSAGYSEAE